MLLPAKTILALYSLSASARRRSACFSPMMEKIRPTEASLSFLRTFAHSSTALSSHTRRATILSFSFLRAARQPADFASGDPFAMSRVTIANRGPHGG